MSTLTNKQIIELTPLELLSFTPIQFKTLESRLKRNVMRHGYLLKKTRYKYRSENEDMYMLLNELGCIQKTGNLFDVIKWAYPDSE